MVYSSKQNSLIKKIASLKDKKGRREHGSYIVEGVKMVSEAIKYCQPIEYIVVSEKVQFTEQTTAEVITVTEQVFSYLSDEVSPQGVL
ncbi:MAG: 23S rRNA (guanosine(2251)-2'-O)-methyltransferase RlmB, partial [Clostridia bacterium]|nr:23S rRNA (guanosine(2251)-2'-O)-methyltransferase RlmB [Clostridia bacterium]